MKIKAFTLAEILIVIGIIGVISAIVIPNVKDNIEERELVSATRKTYTDLKTAHQALITNEGEIFEWDIASNAAASTITQAYVQKLKNYLSVDKDCGTATGCFTLSTYDTNTDFRKIITKSGLMLAIKILHLPDYSNCDYTNTYYTCSYGLIYVDVNGAKGPNIGGQDIFEFDISKKGIEPEGLSNESGVYIYSTGLERNTNWVIKAGNEDYIETDSNFKCTNGKTLNWRTQRSCK